ncbi:hypothetical protein ACFY19_04160 [Streptosporangium saharense]
MTIGRTPVGRAVTDHEAVESGMEKEWRVIGVADTMKSLDHPK